ncbi:DNA cytosine methyltransferase [Burkholderia cenocepacia]|uniref:DNA cytosine methyltransferase n=1 Tax=Burkholderia cenocepacia TaxID=95486 RepID=UPI001B9B7D82|nr:DNA cytosine methyltransferase [Burkholderia cenocepacia]MBR8097690.1 DNA cytosine methyltransferase [Burkholderia cenocepacia]MDI9683533.1 DNA cytosine methyltransferase [Burkholderia cenocepacia]HEP6427770.1 DNA cytosine methyltransferase [Burkholderia cenocepacia]
MKRDLMTLPLDLGSELIVDNFAGGGGASTGLERAFGRPVDIAINHDAEAIAMHLANHPRTAHYCESVFDVDPSAITGNQPVGLVWLSPDCKHFSKAKGGKPVSKKIRGLAWIALRWAATVKPRVIMLENVEEFVTWGPLGADGRPCPKNRGRTFRSFVNALARHGYRVEHRELRACDFGAPTIRKRLFLVARRDGLPIVWPTPTHGDPKSAAVSAGTLQPWRTAADCIDWSIPCPSIFERDRPLKDATLRRIARGIMKFVVNSADPFIVSYYSDETRFRGAPVDEPLGTTTTANRFAVVTPTIMHITHQGDDRTRAADAPLATITTAKRGEQALVTAHITKFRTGSTGSAADEPMHTVTAGGDCVRPAGAAHAMGVVAATLIQTSYGERPGQAPRVPGLDKPLGTVVAQGVKHAAVTAFLAKHYGGVTGTRIDVPAGTVTTSDHHAVVTAQLIGCGGRAAQSRPRDASEPTATLTSKADTTVAVSHLVKLRGTCRDGAPADEPLHTISAGGTHHAEVRAFLIKYYGEGGQWQDAREPMHTIPTRDRIGLVTIHGEDYAIVDIGMRMLTPRELARAQGFPDSYVLDPVVNGKPLSKSAQVRMIGNSVCPDVATALIRANFSHEQQLAHVAA